jgi:hypothetical protein
VRRLTFALGLLVACLAPVSLALAAVEKPNIPAIRSLLSARLKAQHLKANSVVCIRNGRVFRGHAIVRCNVDFGEPHITAYCSVLIAGRLVTQFDVKAIPCSRDSAGAKDIVVSSG